MVHFGKTKIEEMCECQYLFTCYILKEVCMQLWSFYSATFLFLKKPLSTIFFMNTVAHHLIFFMNCCPSEIIVL